MAASGRESGGGSNGEFRMYSDNGEELLHMRVTLASSQGARGHMEDNFLFAYSKDEDNSTSTLLTYAGVFDGHGGKSASEYVRSHLFRFISDDPKFDSQDDDDVMDAIRAGYRNIQNEMMQQLVLWPKTASGTPVSTAGTTASIAIIRNGKLFIGHVGDSKIVLGVSNRELPDDPWTAVNLTVDHTPSNAKERARIESYGGKVVEQNNVSRVVWSNSVQVGPGKMGLITIERPFLSVARSLGDFWSYSPRHKVYLVSPEPDVSVMKLDPAIHRCLILGSDGLWDVLSSEAAVNSVRQTLEATRDEDEPHQVPNGAFDKRNAVPAENPSGKLVDLSLHFWRRGKMKADNVSVITILFEQPPTDQHPTESSSESDGELTEEIILEEDTPSLPEAPYLRPRTRSLSRSGCLDASPSTSNSTGNGVNTATLKPRATVRTEEEARRLFCARNSDSGSSTPSATLSENRSSWNATEDAHDQLASVALPFDSGYVVRKFFNPAEPGKSQVASTGPKPGCKGKKRTTKPKSSANADKDDIQPDLELPAKMMKIATGVVHDKPKKVKTSSAGSSAKKARSRALSPDITCLPP